MRGRLAQLGFLFIKLAHDDRIEAGFTQGVLTVKLPKKPEAIKPEKKVEVKTT